MVDTDTIIHDYVQSQKRLLELELRSEEEEIQHDDDTRTSSADSTSPTLNKGKTPQQEEVPHRILHNLQIEETSIGLLGRTVLTFTSNNANSTTSTTNASNGLLPSHKLTVGDEVEIMTKQTNSFSNNNRRRTGGVITAVTETSISIALFSSPTNNNVTNAATNTNPTNTNSTASSKSSSTKSSRAEVEDENTFLGSCGTNGPFTIVPKSSIQVHRKLMDALQTLDKHGISHTPAGSVLEFVFDKHSKYRQSCFGKDGGKGDGRVPGQSRMDPFNPNLDSSQMEAIHYALEGGSPMALIHGPPGTGKTTTVAELIHQAVHVHKWKVLVTAPSNVAVDNILERLLATNTPSTVSTKNKSSKLRAVRLGHPARIKPSILSHSLESLVQSHDGTAIVQDVRSELLNYVQVASNPKSRGMDKRVAYREMRVLRKEIRQREEKVVDSLIQDAQVVLATNVGAASHVLDKYCRGGDRCFDLVVIDEAAQALEASCWIPILRGKRVVLAGDHCQLPPTIKCNRPDVQRELGKTLFQRIMTMDQMLEKTVKDASEAKKRSSGGVSRMLKVQYRMHEDISDWASNAMYHGRLQSHESVRHRKLQHLPHVKADASSSSIPIGESSLLLIDTTGCDMYESTNQAGSRYNEGEASVVERHVRKLLDIGLKGEEIAVITPYNGQVELLRSTLLTDFPKLEIRSVDGFQGGEREAVVLSLVRSSEKGGKDGIGFLSDKRRLNVAVTRAKRHCAVICDTETVSRNNFLKGLVDWMEEKGDYMSALEVLDTPENPAPLLQDSIKSKSEQRLETNLEDGTLSNKQPATTSDKPKQGTSMKIEEENKRKEEVNETLSFFAQIAEDGEQTEIDVSSSHLAFVHELCSELGLLCEVQQVLDESNVKMAVSKPEKNVNNSGLVGNEKSIAESKIPAAEEVEAARKEEVQETLSFFSQIAEDGEQTEVEVSSLHLTFVHELCSELGLLCDVQQQLDESNNVKVAVSKPDKGETNRDIVGNESTIAEPTIPAAKELEDTRKEKVHEEQTEEKVSSSHATIVHEVHDEAIAESKKPASKEVEATGMNELLGSLARERAARSNKPLPQPSKSKQSKQKKKPKKTGKSKAKKKDDESEEQIDDDMAFLDAQIEKVQTSHGRKVEGSGSNYKSIVNGILLARPKAETKKKDTRLSNALNSKIKNAQRSRKVKSKK